MQKWNIVSAHIYVVLWIVQSYNPFIQSTNILTLFLSIILIAWSGWIFICLGGLQGDSERERDQLLGELDWLLTTERERELFHELVSVEMISTLSRQYRHNQVRQEFLALFPVLPSLSFWVILVSVGNACAAMNLYNDCICILKCTFYTAGVVLTTRF